MKYFLVLGLIINFPTLFGQNKFYFDNNESMKVGAYYYPEHWPESQWDRDLKGIAELGFTFTHFAEFAWAQLEPEDGRFDFAWLDRALAIAEKNNLKVIMCTQSTTPPAWLAVKHPDIFRTDARLIQMEHGARANMSYVNDTLRYYLNRITTEIAKHYGKNPSVIGWQIHNEPYGDFDYSPDIQKRFKQWLKDKYKTIDALNHAWGNAFWGQLYNDFEQIKTPNNYVIQWGINPHALLDYKRFNADMVAEFLDFQAQILRNNISPEQFITTNYIAMIENTDARRVQKLNFATFTNYLVYGDLNIGSQGFRIGNPYGIDFGTAFYKNLGGLTGIMELQPGQVNWGVVNPLVMPGAIRMWLWHAYGAGNSFVCTYRYRQPLYGSEQYHYGIVQTDGVTLASGGKEYVQFIKELNQIEKDQNQLPEMPEELAMKKTAILWSNENRWDVNQQKQTSKWNTEKHMLKYMDIVRSISTPFDIIADSTDFSSYKFLIVPAYQLIDSALAQNWQDYVENGGHLILTCRTGHKNRDGHLWEGKWAAPIVNLIGAEITAYDVLPDGVVANASYKNKTFQWSRWGEILKPETGTTVLAEYSDQFYKGAAAVTTRKIGNGSVTYIGIDTHDGDLEKQVVYSIYEGAGAKNLKLPEGVFVNWRNGYWVAVNYSSEDYNLSTLNKNTYVIGESILKPAGVAVWK